MEYQKYDYIFPYYQGIAIVVADNKYGAILSGGRELIHPHYDYLSSFKNGISHYCLNNVSGKIDLSGNICVQSGNDLLLFDGKKYDGIRDFSEGFATYILNGKCGIIDSEGNEITNPDYDDVLSFHYGIAKVRKNNNWGIINTSGKLLTEIKYKSITNFVKGFATAIEKLDNYDFVHVVLNLKGDSICKAPSGDMIVFNDGYIMVRKIAVAPSGKAYTKYYDYQGNLIERPKLLSLNSICTSKYLISRSEMTDNNDYSYGVKDCNGEVILPSIYKTIIEINDKSKFYEYVKAELFLDYECNFSEYDAYDIDTTVFVNFANQIILSNDVLDVLPAKYYLGKKYVNDFAIVEKYGKWGVINKEHEEVIPLDWDYIYGQKYNLCLAIKDGERYILDYSSKILLKTHESDIILLSQKLFYVGGYCNKIYDIDNNIILENLHHVREESNNIIFSIEENYLEFYGAIDSNGNLIVPCEYNSVACVEHTFIATKKDILGNRILEDKYDIHGTLISSVPFDVNKIAEVDDSKTAAKYKIIHF